MGVIEGMHGGGGTWRLMRSKVCSQLPEPHRGGTKAGRRLSGACGGNTATCGRTYTKGK